MQASSSQFAYKESLVQEMRELVYSFHSEMCIKITLMIKKYDQAMKEINSKRKSIKQPKSFGKLCKESPTNMIINPVYSMTPGEHAFDMKRKLLGCKTTKSILEQTQPWYSPNPAALNQPRKRSYPGSVCLSLTPDCTSLATSKDDRRETNLYKSNVKRSWMKIDVWINFTQEGNKYVDGWWLDLDLRPWVHCIL